VTLLATALLENLRASYDVFIRDQFSALFTPPTGTINYEGTGEEDAVLEAAKEWLEPFLLGPARPEAGAGRFGEMPGEFLRRTVPIFQVNIFSRPRRQASARRLVQLRDLVAGRMHPGLVIPVTDYVGDRGLLGTVPLRRVSMDQRVPLGPEYEDQEQWTYAVEGAWIEGVTHD